eukprot:6062-Heterococcus_DN1.PRE.3
MSMPCNSLSTSSSSTSKPSCDTICSRSSTTNQHVYSFRDIALLAAFRLVRTLHRLPHVHLLQCSLQRKYHYTVRAMRHIAARVSICMQYMHQNCSTYALQRCMHSMHITHITRTLLNATQLRITVTTSYAIQQYYAVCTVNLRRVTHTCCSSCTLMTPFPSASRASNIVRKCPICASVSCCAITFSATFFSLFMPTNLLSLTLMRAIVSSPLPVVVAPAPAAAPAAVPPTALAAAAVVPVGESLLSDAAVLPCSACFCSAAAAANQ